MIALRLRNSREREIQRAEQEKLEKAALARRERVRHGLEQVLGLPANSTAAEIKQRLAHVKQTYANCRQNIRQRNPLARKREAAARKANRDFCSGGRSKAPAEYEECHRGFNLKFGRSAQLRERLAHFNLPMESATKKDLEAMALSEHCFRVIEPVWHAPEIARAILERAEQRWPEIELHQLAVEWMVDEEAQKTGRELQALANARSGLRKMAHRRLEAATKRAAHRRQRKAEEERRKAQLMEYMMQSGDLDGDGKITAEEKMEMAGFLKSMKDNLEGDAYSAEEREEMREMLQEYNKGHISEGQIQRNPMLALKIREAKLWKEKGMLNEARRTNLDADHDGHVSAWEAACEVGDTGMANTAQQYLLKQALDADGDGKVSTEEMSAVGADFDSGFSSDAASAILHRRHEQERAERAEKMQREHEAKMQEYADAREAFKAAEAAMDLNGDGVTTWDERKMADLNGDGHYSASEANAAKAALDMDGDGIVTEHEMNVASAIDDLEGMDLDGDDAAGDTIKHTLDLDGDGIVDEDELEAADLDGDGKISPEEMEELIRFAQEAASNAALDLDGDSVVTADELAVADTDGDGIVDDEERRKAEIARQDELAKEYNPELPGEYQIGEYHVDLGKVYYKGQLVEGMNLHATDDNVEDVGGGYAKIGDKLYFNGQEVGAITVQGSGDLENLGNGFVKNTWGPNGEFSQVYHMGQLVADPKTAGTFEQLGEGWSRVNGSGGEAIYFKDGEQVDHEAAHACHWYNKDVEPGTDVDYKYYLPEEMRDPVTPHVNTQDGNVYYNGEVIGTSHDQFGSNITDLGNGYAIRGDEDGKCQMMFNGKPTDDVFTTGVENLGNGYIKTQYGVYFNGEKMADQFDAAKFEQLGNGWSRGTKDTTGGELTTYYYRGEEVGNNMRNPFIAAPFFNQEKPPDADVSFDNRTPEEYCEDKNNYAVGINAVSGKKELLYKGQSIENDWELNYDEPPTDLGGGYTLIKSNDEQYGGGTVFFRGQKVMEAEHPSELSELEYCGDGMLKSKYGVYKGADTLIDRKDRPMTGDDFKNLGQGWTVDQAYGAPKYYYQGELVEDSSACPFYDRLNAYQRH